MSASPDFAALPPRNPRRCDPRNEAELLLAASEQLLRMLDLARSRLPPRHRAALSRPGTRE
ncbi:MAG: hypothetical protein U0835_26970 [Isosphaeraceae bacterium]